MGKLDGCFWGTWIEVDLGPGIDGLFFSSRSDLLAKDTQIRPIYPRHKKAIPM